MDPTLLAPVIVEATKFMFSEVGKWLDQVRKRSENAAPKSSEIVLPETAPKLTQQEFAFLESNPQYLIATIDVHQAQTNAYEIEKLVEQIQIHRRNLVDNEATEAEFGALTPQHIKRAIEREATAIVDKSARLRNLLEQVYGRKIQNA